MSEAKKMVTDIVAEIEAATELFYQQKDMEALVNFEQCLGKMSIAIDTIFSYASQHTDFSFDDEKIKSILVEAMNALEMKDMIMMADILQYDFVEYMQELLAAME